MICEIVGGLTHVGELNVMIEAPAYGAVGRSVDTAQLHGAVRVGLMQCGVWPKYGEALTIRRLVLGTGCKKKEAVAKVLDAFKLDFPTSDECDAYLIMRAAEMTSTDNLQPMLSDVTYLVKRLRARNG
jgi:hypothetical protein